MSVYIYIYTYYCSPLAFLDGFEWPPAPRFTRLALSSILIEAKGP